MASLGFDAKAILEDAERYGGRRVKREWVLKGYKNQISLYGTLIDAEAGKGWTPRIEILSDVPWTEKNVALLYDFFKDLKPKWYYSIWLYSGQRESVRMVWKYGAR